MYLAWPCPTIPARSLALDCLKILAQASDMSWEKGKKSGGGRGGGGMVINFIKEVQGHVDLGS